MIVLSWTLFALLALFWTGAAWVTAAGTEWALQALASGAGAEAARGLATLPVPEWLKFWIEPAWIQWLQSALHGAIDGAAASLPLARAATSWLVPAIWIAWALGMLVLLVGAAGVHMLLRRLASRRLRRAPVPRTA
ncbi:MAG: hypothetical protein JWQ13_2165 [Ramlibacter sp.]|jgi:hypothetical protein|nr:hypothetical protein [Ramlibacter sp.]